MFSQQVINEYVSLEIIMGCEQITSFLPTITKFNQFLYTFSCNNTLIFNKNKCRLL